MGCLHSQRTSFYIVAGIVFLLALMLLCFMDIHCGRTHSFSCPQHPLPMQPISSLSSLSKDTDLHDDILQSSHVFLKRKKFNFRMLSNSVKRSKSRNVSLLDSNVVSSVPAWLDHEVLETKLNNVSDLMEMGPFPFLNSFRNPCWKSQDSGDLHCLPYFYLAGFPKCGTTDLYRRIGLHPSVATTEMKEPHWITRCRLSKNSETKDFTYYTNIFSKALLKKYNSSIICSSCVVGDGSASTVWQNIGWDRMRGNQNYAEPRVIIADYIRHLNPDVKIIIMMRNPTNRLYSDFAYFRKENKSKEEFHRDVERQISVFNACLKTRSLRNCAYNSTLANRFRLHIGLYFVFIQDWQKRFARDQLLFLRSEDVVNDTMYKVFKFLSLKRPDKQLRQQLKELTKQNVQYKKEDMMEKTRFLLNDFYRPYNKRLAALLSDRRYMWTDP